MGRKSLSLAAFLAAAAFSLVAHADSPLTSIDLFASYSDVPAVKEAQQWHKAGGAVLAFLLSDSPTDQKAAVVSALGWNFNGQQNATLFLQGLAKSRNLDPETLELKDLSPSERFVAGYLVAMDDYLELKPLRPGGRGVWGKKPGDLLDSAAAALPDDFAVQYVRALVRAQKAMDKAWCEVFTGPKAVTDRFPPERRNLRPGAVAAAQEYLGLYEENCPGSKAASTKQRDELNQIYALAKLGSQIVAGTQAGVVVWDPDRPAPVATFPEFICGHVVVWGNAAWAGCDKQVVRWDGQAFKSYLKNDANDATYFAPMLGPEGSLWVRYGAQTWAFDKERGSFRQVKAPWTGSPYDALVAKDGEVWWIDFLAAVRTPQRTLKVKGAEYPGKDPRHFSEDAAGALWVEDFESGFLRLDKANGKFVKEPGVDKQGSGVAFDLDHERLFLLHYRNGLTITQNGHVLQTIDLHELEYMRTMLFDHGEVWIGGWNQLLRLRERDGQWVREPYLVK
jgi:hypothetical protein